MSKEESVFQAHGDELIVRVKVKPGARQDAVLGVRAGQLLVSVRAAPEKGRATEAAAAVLARRLGVPRAQVVLRTGAASPRKLFAVPLSARAALEAAVRQGREET